MSEAEDAAQQETVEGLLDASKRSSARVNIRQSFVQGGPQGSPVPGPLHRMLKQHDERALDLFLLHRALVSAAPWTSRALDSRVWARAIGVHSAADGGVAAVSKTWRRLEENYHVIERGRSGRLAIFTALKEDGSGDPYTSPTGGSRESRYLTVPFAYWNTPQRWYANLTFPGKAMLLVASSLEPGFALPADRAPAWYGISSESADRGLRELREVGLLNRVVTVKPAPLSPAGTKQEYRYTLQQPFGRRRGGLSLVRTAEAS